MKSPTKQKRGENRRSVPYVRAAEEIAADLGFEPMKLPVLLMSEHERRIMAWYEDLQRGIVPSDFLSRSTSKKMHTGEAWDIWYKEAADYLPLAERWMEYFHGKKQRIEQQIEGEVTQNVVSGKPITREEFEDRLEAARGAAGDSS